MTAYRGQQGQRDPGGSATESGRGRSLGGDDARSDDGRPRSPAGARQNDDDRCEKFEGADPGECVPAREEMERDRWGDEDHQIDDGGAQQFEDCRTPGGGGAAR